MKRKGFTIVELLVVIAILGILMGIISTASIGAIRNGRSKRASAMCSVMNQAVAAYYAQKGEWPAAIEAKARNSGSIEDQWVQLEPKQADSVFQEIVKKSTGANASMPLVDASALFVADSSNVKNNNEGCYDNHGNRNVSATFCGDKHCIPGVDFSVATQKSGKHHISVNNMAFGYQGTTEGRFRRFWIYYAPQQDTVKVDTKNWKKES